MKLKLKKPYIFLNWNNFGRSRECGVWRGVSAFAQLEHENAAQSGGTFIKMEQKSHMNTNYRAEEINVHTRRRRRKKMQPPCWLAFKCARTKAQRETEYYYWNNI